MAALGIAFISLIPSDFSELFMLLYPETLISAIQEVAVFRDSCSSLTKCNLLLPHGHSGLFVLRSLHAIERGTILTKIIDLDH